MFCPNCGAKNTDISEFCENCGAKISTSVNTKAKGKEKRPLTKSSKVLILELLILIIAFVMCLMIYKSKFSPENAAKRYMESVLTGNWSSVYDVLVIDDKGGDFMTKEAFVTAQTLNGGASVKKASVSDVLAYEL